MEIVVPKESKDYFNYYVVENENHGTNLKEIEDSAIYLKSIL